MSDRRRVLIVKAGSTLPEIARRLGDFELWIQRAMGLRDDEVGVVAPCDGESLPDPSGWAGVVVTGSAAFVSDREPWSERTAEWLPAVLEAGVPLLGICYGHQLLAHGLGGVVGRNPRGREIGTVEVDLAEAARVDDPLLGRAVSPALVHATHLESVLTLPPGAVPLGTNAADPNHAFRLGKRSWGVQFHPEFDADVVRGYVAARMDDLRNEGLDPEAILARIRESPDGPAVLARFAAIVAACDAAAGPAER